MKIEYDHKPVIGWDNSPTPGSRSGYYAAYDDWAMLFVWAPLSLLLIPVMVVGLLTIAPFALAWWVIGKYVTWVEGRDVTEA